MNESLKLWAKYNLATDEKVHQLLVGLGEAEYTKERNTYFKSLAALHLHYVQTYRAYCGLIRKNWGDKYLVSPLTEESYEVTAKSLEEVGTLSMEYGKLLAAFCATVSDSDLAGPKTKRLMRSGKTILVSMGDIMIQLVNHTAHHRGQLSQLLDELGVEHDIGGILGHAEEAKA